ncbi:MAG TPA: hypothetical protein VE688_12650 [Gaiellaceae bacterium]|jgi:hypothetical protein|nr:hypothetical protein [Gaiellaceae bacterium]
MRVLLAVSLAGVTALLVALPATATTGKGQLFHDGSVVGTVITPSPIAPGSGTDPFYNVTNGASGQLGIAGVAPGDGPYHGGSWQVYLVTFNPGVTPYLLTSDEAVFAARDAGDVTVTRAGDADFRCPLTQPNGG